MLATCMRRMRNNNLEIRIAGSLSHAMTNYGDNVLETIST